MFFQPIAKFRWVHDGVFVDRDGSLSGAAGNKILPWMDTLDPDHCVKDDRFSIGDAEGAVCDSTTSFARMSFNKYVLFLITDRVVPTTVCLTGQHMWARTSSDVRVYWTNLIAVY